MYLNSTLQRRQIFAVECPLSRQPVFVETAPLRAVPWPFHALRTMFLGRGRCAFGNV